MNDPAMTKSGYDRVKNDFYPTPGWVTMTVLSHLPLITGPVWEPACGDGQMSSVLKQQYNVVETDLNDYGVGRSGVDFLATTTALAPNIITNPPYQLAEEFLRHALALTKSHHGVVAMVLRNEFDSAKTRRDLFATPPFHKKLVLTKRPLWFSDKNGSPRHNYSWFIFDWKSVDAPVLSYTNGDKP